MSRMGTPHPASAAPATPARRTFRIQGGRVTARPADPLPSPPVAPEPVVEAAPVAPAVPTDEQVRTLAYQKWEAAGCPPGDGVAFWRAAEQELAGR